MAELRHCDIQPRLAEGRAHLGYSFELAATQREEGRQAHAENPLTSRAWKEPAAVKELSRPEWHRARLDQCTTGLSGPQGDLHLKPTMIRTTDDAMRDQLHRLCPGTHTHELVQGQATALSAMYSPHLAMLIATVVMKGRGGGESVRQAVTADKGDQEDQRAPVGGNLSRVGEEREPEARSAPGFPSEADPWKQPMLPPQHEGGPLAPPVEEEVRKACEEYLEYTSAHPYDREVFKGAATKGTLILKAAGSWKEANRALRRTWVETQGDHFQELHGDFFEGLVDEGLLAKARSNAIWGISARSDCDTSQRVRCNPHPSLKEHLDEAGAQLWKDAQRGRALILEDRGGKELEGVISVPMARVPKMLPDRTLSSKGRVIWDATPVNKTCHKTRHPPALQPRHAEMARVILWWKHRFPGLRIFLSKKDVSDAFKWIPVRQEDTRLFAADLPGQAFGSEHPLTVIYNTLTFGWTGAPGEFMLYAWLAKLGHAGHYPSQSCWHDSTSFRSLVLMDDTVLVEPDLGVRPWMSVAVSEQCTKAALGPKTINAEKDVIEGALEEEKLVWGLIYNTRSGTRSLPAAKLEKASYLLHLSEFDYGNVKIPLKLLQELRGNQQFWLTILPTLANLLQATNDLLGEPDAQGNAVAKGTEEQRRRTWRRFWEAIELQRLLVDNRASWETRFTHPMVEALSVEEMISLQGNKVVWASGDATLERIGAVDWSGRVAFSAEAGPLKIVLQQFMREAVEAGETKEGYEEDGSGFIISILELLTLVALVAARARHWEGNLVAYAGDNTNVISWLEKRGARHPVASYLLQVLSAIEAAHAIRVHGAYIRTYHNETADDLTRLDAAEVMKSKGLKDLGNPTEDFVKYLSRGWIRRALLWSGQSNADKEQALRLADRRENPAIPCELTSVCLLDVSVLDLSGGGSPYLREFVLRGATCYAEAGVRVPDSVVSSWDGTKERVDLLCFTFSLDSTDSLRALRRGALRARPSSVWVDTRKEVDARKAEALLKGEGYRGEVKQISGRTLQEQVWWRRWVVAMNKKGEVTIPCHGAEEEPITQVPGGYDLHWLDEGDSGPTIKGALKLDPGLPFLGATTPKPMGHVVLPGGKRKLLWAPKGPLPALHLGSWNADHEDPLLLLLQTPEGPFARALREKEAQALLYGRKVRETDEEEGILAGDLLKAAPRGLATLAAVWAQECQESNSPVVVKGEGSCTVGVCALEWERETEKILLQWVAENPPQAEMSGAGRVGGKRSRRKMPEDEAISKALSRLLRHEAGTDQIPITHEGWVRWEHAMQYSRLRSYSQHAVWEAIENNAKERFTSERDEEGYYWIAAWSGHTIPDCVGPSREVPEDDVPKLLVHGTYRKHVPQIEVQGLKRFRRDLHLQDPFSHARRWRKGLEVKVNVDAVVAMEHGCRFRVTGNLVWLCDRDIPTDAIVYIEEWDDLVAKTGRTPPVVGDVGGSADRRGVWEPDGSEWNFGPRGAEPRLVTQEVAEVARDFGAAVAGYPEVPSITVNPDTWEVILKEEESEARYSPGNSDEDSCDWSGDEEEPLVVEAEPASGSFQKGNITIIQRMLDKERLEREAAEAARKAKPPTTAEDVEMTEVGEATGRPGSSEQVDPVAGEEPEIDKTVLEADEPAPPRPKWFKFGSAQIHILQAVAAADASNWNSLQQCLKEHESDPKQKSQLVSRLEQLADIRQASRAGALKALKEHREHANDVTEQENLYQHALGMEAARLERFNPVGPRATQPLITTNRLEADIAAGVGVWKARRDHRARERAAQHRKAQAEGSGAAPENAGTLVDVPTEEHGEAVDAEMQQRAKQEIRSFRKDLRAEEGGRETEAKKTHQKDSARRRKLKRDRYKEKIRAKRTHDDADRDSNHAIAHCRSMRSSNTEARSAPGASFAMLQWMVWIVWKESRHARPVKASKGKMGRKGTVARSAPGTLFILICSMIWGVEGLQVEEALPEGGAVTGAILAFAILCIVGGGLSWWRFWYTRKPPNVTRPNSSRKVGGRRRVRFKKEDSGRDQPGTKTAEVPFLGGPAKAKRLSPAGARLRFASVQGAAEWEQESLALMLDRYAASTKGVYQSQLKWWNLFCLRRDIDPIRVQKSYDRAEEQIFLDFLVHCSSNELRAPGTVKLRLAAVRSYHLTLGLPDPTANMPRIPLALLGIKRRYGTKERRRPVTPTMLNWIGEVLEYGRKAEAALVWAAIAFGFFFLLRASEYLDVGYTDPGKGMRGMDVLLREKGTYCRMERIPYADEVVLTVRGSKTDIYNKGESRNHFAASDRLCPVKATINLFRHFPQRYRGGSEDQAPLFRTEDGKVLPRAAVTSLLSASAKALGMAEGDLGTHSLRFGGASAIWASYGDSQMVKRWGRWSSDSFQTYIWDARKSAQGVAERMSRVDLTPT